MFNKINFEIAPNNISDDSYFKIKINNDLYLGSEEKRVSSLSLIDLA